MPTAHDMFSRPDPAYLAFEDDKKTYAVTLNGSGTIDRRVFNPSSSTFMWSDQDVRSFSGFHIPAFLTAASGADPSEQRYFPAFKKDPGRIEPALQFLTQASRVQTDGH